VSSRSHATVHQDSAEKASMARVNVRAYAHDGTAMWKWIGVAVVAAVLAAVYGYEP
jgi:hypothetical protein